MQYSNRLCDLGTKLLPIIGVGAAAYLAGQTLLSSVACIKDILKQAFKDKLIKTYGKGSYALVTGASEGIGKAFCEELTREGFNIVLISRSRNKLQKAVADLKKIREDVETKIIVADFTKSHEEGFYESIENDLQDIDVSILVNNVGLETMKTFEEISPEFIKDLITVNTLSVVLMSRIMIKKFRERKESKGRSAIINVASLSGLRPVPFFNPYGSSKAYIDFFSRSLASELHSSRIDVVSFRPGYVATALTMKEPSINTITANECARGVLDKLGIEAVTNGHWKHKLLGGTITFFPEFLYLRAIRPIIGKEMKRRKAIFGHGGHQDIIFEISTKK